MIQIDPAAETQRVAGLVVKALTDLGYSWTRADGGVVTVRYHTTGYGVMANGCLVAVLEIDTLRLPRKVTARDLTKPETLHHLSTVVGHPCQVLNTTGVTYVVRLTPPPPAPRLPSKVPLDLGTRPDGALMVPLGIGREGAVWQPLASLGHTLVTGASGSGKSNWLHAALAAVTSATGPDQLRLALVDPKVSEFAAWAHVPHLWDPIATDEMQAAKLLARLVDEVDRRGELLAGALVRDLASYNRQAPVKLPHLLLIFDEVLDLLLAAGGEKSDLARALTRLAVKGRSAGILLWIASQHARFDLLPRAVSVNLASRLVFRVSDQSAAQLAGCPGAERIRRDRPGRFLARVNGGTLAGYQAFVLPDEQLLSLVGHVAKQDLAPKSNQLSADEIALVDYAVHELSGAFTIGKLAKAFTGRIGQHAIRDLAARWEREGLLTTPATITDPRRVTPQLAALAGCERWMFPDDTPDTPNDTLTTHSGV
jgi:hypothetical protein